jgi:DNA-binding CsgD family transcriptional regulator
MVEATRKNRAGLGAPRQMGKESHDLLLDQTVDGLYEAAADPGTWPDVLDRFDRLFQSTGAHVFLWDEAANKRIAAYRSHSFSENQPEWDYYHRINPRRRILAQLPLGTPMNCSDYLDDAAVQRSEFFVDYSLPAGRRYLLGTNAIKEEAVTTAFAVMREPGQNPFSAMDTMTLGRLMPDLRRAARIGSRVRAAQGAREMIGAALDNLTDAVLVVDATSKLVRGNLSANKMLEVGIPLRMRNGRLCGGREIQTARLARLVANAAHRSVATDGDRGGTLVLAAPDGGQWAVIVAPLMPRVTMFDLSDRRLVMVIVSSLTAPASIESRLCDAFGLTRAEARLAGRIIAGETLNEISDVMDVSLATLRTQLKSIFQKTDTNRQGQLMQIGARLDRIL